MVAIIGAGRGGHGLDGNFRPGPAGANRRDCRDQSESRRASRLAKRLNIPIIPRLSAICLPSKMST